jgi:hypothetical protein
MDPVLKPVVRLWNYVEQVGGFPGQMLFICAIIMAVIGGLTWFGNKR